MTNDSFAPDEIGPWSEIKLEIIEKYGPAYTQAFSGKGRNLKKFYIDGFSGAGLHVSKATGAKIEGSPARALKVSPPFDGFCFIDLNKDKTEYLQKQCQGRSGVQIFTGDCNAHLTKEVLPKIQYKLYTRALCLLDPYVIRLVVKNLGKWNLKIIIDSTIPKKEFHKLTSDEGQIYEVEFVCRRLGVDNGMLTLYHGENNIKGALEHMNSVTRSPEG